MDGSPQELGRREEAKHVVEERGSDRKRRFTDASRNIGISMKENIENELGAEEQNSQKKQIIKVHEVKERVVFIFTYIKCKNVIYPSRHLNLIYPVIYNTVSIPSTNLSYHLLYSSCHIEYLSCHIFLTIIYF